VSRRVVFLCTGNICRSPLAEVIARDMFAGYPGEFASAGLEAMVGWPAMELSRNYATEHGLSLAAHRAQNVTTELLVGTVWVISMTRSHAAIFRSRYGARYQGAIGILGAPGVDMVRQRYSTDSEEVDDPYNCSAAVYQNCGQQITRLLDAWAPIFDNVPVAVDGAADQEL